MLETITNINLKEIDSYILKLISENQHITEYKLRWINPNVDIYDFKFNSTLGELKFGKYIEEYSKFILFINTSFGDFSFTIYDFAYIQNGISKELSQIIINWNNVRNFKCSLQTFKTYSKEIKIEPKKIEYYLKAFIKCILTNNFECDITDSILRLIQSTFTFLDSEQVY